MGSTTGRYSRFMYNERKRYVHPLMQERVAVVDADVNESYSAFYTQLRRAIQILGDGAPNDGFKIEGSIVPNDFLVKGGGGEGDDAGRLFIKGLGCQLFDDVNYTNIGANEDELSIHSVVTALYYDSGLDRTVITDSSANFPSPDTLTSRTLTLNIAVPTGPYAIVANTATTISISGDKTSEVAVGDHYRIELSTPPVGPTRYDAVFVNIYLDEIDSVEDPNLIHTPSVAVEAQLRLQLVQNIFVEEDVGPGGGSLSDYVDIDGNRHYVFKIAELARPGGNDTINTGMVTDLRPLYGDGTNYGLVALWQEVIDARGSTTCLDCRLDVSLNEDGTLKDVVERHNFLPLKPTPNSPADNRIRVFNGRYTSSNGRRVVDINDVSGYVLSPVILPVTVGTNVRYDVLSADDTGNIVVTSGVEVIAPGDPFTDAPDIPTDALGVAIVGVTETGTVIIDTSDITDVREIFTKAGAGGGGGAGGSPVVYEEFTATEGQTDFTLSGGATYTMGTHSLFVFRNGNLQDEGASGHYQELTNDTIRFNTGVHAGEKILMVVLNVASTAIEPARHDQVAPDPTYSSLTKFAIPFTWTLDGLSLRVYSGGVLQRPTIDYTEHSGYVEFLTPRTPGENQTFIRVGVRDSTGASHKPALCYMFIATEGQQDFSLPMDDNLYFQMGDRSLLVFRNGKLLIYGTIRDDSLPEDEDALADYKDYVEVSSRAIHLNYPAKSGDEILFLVPNGGRDGGVSTMERLLDVTSPEFAAFKWAGNVNPPTPVDWSGSFLPSQTNPLATMRQLIGVRQALQPTDDLYPLYWLWLDTTAGALKIKTAAGPDVWTQIWP